MAEYYLLMEIDYSWGCDNLDSHVQNVLVNIFWPIIKRSIFQIAKCLNKGDPERLVNLNVSFVKNRIVHFKNIEVLYGMTHLTETLQNNICSVEIWERQLTFVGL